MTYPTAIVIAAALIAGAILSSSHGSASPDGSGVSVAATDGSTVWVARQGGELRVCRLDTRGTAQLAVMCSDWTP